MLRSGILYSTRCVDGPDTVCCLIDSDTEVVYFDKNWPKTESIGIPLAKLEEFIQDYKKTFKGITNG